MFNELNGIPDEGGEWYHPNNDSVIDTFDPLTSEVGTYTYVVEGINACPSDSQFLYIDYQEGFEMKLIHLIAVMDFRMAQLFYLPIIILFHQ